MEVQRWAAKPKKQTMREVSKCYKYRCIMHPTNTICFCPKENGSGLTKYD